MVTQRRMLGVVLAGGAGRRFGAPKGGHVHHGETLAARAAGKLAGVCGDVAISLAPGAGNPAPDYPAIADRAPAGRGPLAGLDAVWDAVGDADLLVLACDYPDVPGGLLKELARRAPAADVTLAAEGDGGLHPLVACWTAAARPHVAAAVQAGELQVMGPLARLRTGTVRPAELGLDDDVLVNVNRPADLRGGSPPPPARS